MRKARTPDRIEWPTVALILATYLCFGLLTWFHAAVPWWAFIPLGAYIGGLHHTFLVLGGFTIVSGLLFRGLRRMDGANVSHFMLRQEAVA